MSEKEFKEKVIALINEKYPDAEVKETVVKKVNEEYDGLCVFRPGATASPVINLDMFYPIYMENGMKAIEDDICRVVETKPSEEILKVTDEISDYNNVISRLYLRLSNADRNADYLKDKPHKTVEDLAISAHILCEVIPGMEASTPVSHDMLKSYGITEEQLFEDAMENSQKIKPAKVENLSSVLEDVLGTETQKSPLTVVTNKDNAEGAVALFYPETLKKIPEGAYILPSSVHEVLIMDDEGADPEELAYTVKAANNSVVSPEEILSYHVYQKKNGKIAIAV